MKKKTVSRPFFTLWNPLSDYPPRKMFGTAAEAERVAADCVRKWRQPVFVMRSVSESSIATQPIKTRRFRG